MRVAGIDPALGGTGLAAATGRTYRIHERKGTDAYDRIPAAVNRILDLIVDDVRPDLVVLEAYAGGSPGRLSVIRSIEFGGHLRISLRLHDIPFVDVAPLTLKCYATGNGRAEKDAMVDTIPTRMGLDYPGLSHDEADALWLRDVGLWALGDPDAVGPHHRAEPNPIGGLRDRMGTGLAAAGLTPREDG